jgi:hypothetical protein
MTSQPQISKWARFHARFDDVLMSAPAWGAHQTVADCADAGALAQALGALCPAGASSRPGFACAGHTLAPLPAARAQQQVWLNQQLLLLDGTLHMLQLGGPWRQRLHRLAIKLQELRHSGDGTSGLPWDCGWLNTTAAAQAQAERFIPRRPTLMVAWQLSADTVSPLRAVMQQRRANYAHRVVLWVLDAPAVHGSAVPQTL